MKKFFALFVILVCALWTSVALGAENYVEGDALVVFRLPRNSSQGEEMHISSFGKSYATSVATATTEEGEYFKIVETYDGLTELSIQNYENADKPSTPYENTYGVSSYGDDLNGGSTNRGNNSEVPEPGIFALVHSDVLSTDALVAKLRERVDVLAASPNYYVYGMDGTVKSPNDPGYTDTEGKGHLWGIKMTRAPEVWSMDVDYSTGSQDIYVAIIDSGIDAAHPDLEGNYCAAFSKRYVNDGYDLGQDPYGHGTHVAGTIAAVGNNGKGVVGMNWHAKLIDLRVLNANNSGSGSDINGAINELANILLANPNIVLPAVNLSLGGYRDYPPATYSTEQYPEWLAYKALDQTNRAMIVVSAGNEDNEVGAPGKKSKVGQYCYPASFLNLNNLITVGAAEADNVENPMSYTKASFSNYSKEFVPIAAPGVKIVSTRSRTEGCAFDRTTIGDSNDYAPLQGTSMAAPHVTGAVVLLKSVFPDASLAAIKKALFEGANKSHCIEDNNNNFTKYGFLDVKAAYDILEDSKSKGDDLSCTITVYPQVIYQDR